jgi:hypothetical protein
MGQWVAGVPSGWGVVIYNSQEMMAAYRGMFAEGVPSGLGTGWNWYEKKLSSKFVGHAEFKKPNSDSENYAVTMTKCQEYFGGDGVVNGCEALMSGGNFFTHFIIDIGSKTNTLVQPIDATTVDTAVATTPAATL